MAMKWLRQHNRVEALSAEAEQCAGQMKQLRQHLGQRVHARLQDPGTMTWAFAAGVVYGGSKRPERDAGQNTGSASQAHPDRAFPILRYLNSAVIVWNLLSQFQPEPPNA
jgi:hypothetical protein